MNESQQSFRMKMFPKPEVTITALEASGTRILTEEYGPLCDLQSGCWAAVLGHNRRELSQVLAENADKLFHLHHFFDTEHIEALVRELTAAAGLKSIYKGSFLSSGSEAVALAVLLAELVTGRSMKLCLSISYLGASADLRMPRDKSKWLDIDVEECLSCDKLTDCRECGKFATVAFEEMAAFVFEPGNSGGLVLCPPEKLIAYLVQAVKGAGGCIIANEVTTGFGRTGKWFGYQHYTVFDTEALAPDFIALGKGLGNGYPISGVLVKAVLGEAIEATGFRYLQSHIDDPMGLMIARKVIQLMVEEALIAKGNKMGEYLRFKLDEVAEATGAIAEIRGRGMMNVVIIKNTHRAGKVFEALLTRGIFTGYSDAYNYIHLYPALTITHEEIDHLCDSLAHALQHLI